MLSSVLLLGRRAHPFRSPLRKMKAGPQTAKTQGALCPQCVSGLQQHHGVSSASVWLLRERVKEREEAPGSRVSSRVPFQGRKPSPAVAHTETKRKVYGGTGLSHMIDKKELSLHRHDYSGFSLPRSQMALERVAFQGRPWDWEETGFITLFAVV